jgi:L-threonate 2-dehydrogenase
MSHLVAVVGTGAMGSAIGQRLRDNGATVLTSLAGRSAAARARAEAAGMVNADDSRLVAADFVLSIVSPAEALGVARRLAPALRDAGRKPAFIDCNAVSTQTASLICDAIAESGAPYVDAGIIGSPPRPGEPGPAIFVSGPAAVGALALREFGLDVRDLDGPLGAENVLCRDHQRATRSRHGEEIATFAGGDEAAQAIYRGFALLFEHIAADDVGERADIAVIEAFWK